MLGDHAFAVAKSAWFSILLAVEVVVSVVAGTVVMAAEVNDSVIVGFSLFIGGIFISIIGWSLVLLVRLSQVVAKLETQGEDHDRRLSNLE